MAQPTADIVATFYRGFSDDTEVATSTPIPAMDQPAPPGAR